MINYNLCYILQVVETILECEELGVVHRDIKDENILVSTRQEYQAVSLLQQCVKFS
jgi:serine/threonine protein kinase